MDQQIVIKEKEKDSVKKFSKSSRLCLHKGIREKQVEALMKLCQALELVKQKENLKEAS